MINKGVLKIMERLSYQELIFLYDRVETLEQSEEVQKLGTEIKEQMESHVSKVDEKSVKLELEMKDQIDRLELALKE